MMPMRGGVASLSRKSFCKEQSSKDVCIERMKLSELALQRWKDLGDAHKAYNDLQSWKALGYAHKANDNDLQSPMAKFVSTHSSDAGEQKQEHHGKEDPNKQKTKAGAASRIQANVEVRGLRELLVDFDGQFQKTLEDIGSVCKLLEIDTVQEQTTTKGNSSSNLLRSFSRSFSFKIISSARRSRSSKVRSLPSDEKDGEHSSTLKYLSAWEKQLYYQVEKLSDEKKIGGAREVEVAKQSAVLIFNQIKQLRDQELSPQLDNLLGALTAYWMKISDCYNTQAMIMSDIIAKSLFNPPHRMSCEARHLKAATMLKAELEELLAKFTNLASSHKAYIKALHDWARYPFPAFCEENSSNDTESLLEKWSNCSEKLFADVPVTKAMSDLVAKVGELVELQNKEHEHKRQVNQLNDEDWKIGKSSKTKDKSKLRQKIKEEEVKHEDSRKETEKTAVNLVQTGFTSLYQSLAEFSKHVAQSYGDVDRQNNASAEVNR